MGGGGDRPFFLMRSCLGLLLVSAAIGSRLEAAEPAPAAAHSRGPNIVFIMADDLGWADVAFHGGRAPTPHLDRLAAEGVELTRHYVAPVCSPTRTGLLTGRCWSRFGVTSPQNGRALPWDTLTLPRALRSRGYETCLTGKWHLGSTPAEGPSRFGFDHSYGSLAGGVGPYDHQYKTGPFVKTWHRNEQLLEESGHVTDLIAREACQWIAQRGQRPFFLYVPLTAVHLPVKEPAEWLAKVPPQIMGAVPRQYAACIMHLDDAVGRIVAALDKAGRREETLIVFTSDNGGSTAENANQPYPPDDYPQGKLPGDNRPFRGEKGTVYEGGIRVPCLANWPGRLQPGKHAAAAQITDWLPTFAALTGYEPTGDVRWDGVNLWPQLAEGKPPRERWVYTVGPGFRARALHHGDWKLIEQAGKDGPRIELYNLAQDPSETTDLAAQHPQQQARLKELLAQVSRADRDRTASKDEPQPTAR